MNIAQKYILEFQELWEKHFQESISYDEAVHHCLELVEQVKAVYNPVKKDFINEPK